MMATNATSPNHDQSAPKRLRLMANGMATSSGTAMATGPLVMTPRAMAAQARIDQCLSFSTAKKNEISASVMKNVSALSKITVREKAMVSGIDNIAIALAHAASESFQMRRAN